MNAEARNGTTRKVTLWVLTGFCVCLVVFAIAVASVFKREGMSPLHRAVQVNSPIALRSFLFFGTNPNSADKASGDTPLHYAARQGRADMVSILLNRKAGVDTPNNSGETPLHIASYAGNTPVVQLLVDAGTDLKKKEKKYGATPLHFASYKDNRDAVVALLCGRADVDVFDTDGATPLHYAALGNARLATKALLAGGSHAVNARDRNQDTPLLKACRKGCVDVVGVLLDNGAKADIVDKNGATPLHLLAASAGNLEKVQRIIDAFVQSGADINATNEKGQTVFFMIATAEHAYSLGDVTKNLMAFLVARGANVNIQDNNGLTPLFYYVADYDSDLVDWAKSRIAQMVRFLIQSGADVNLKNKAGRTVLDNPIAIPGRGEYTIKKAIRDYVLKANSEVNGGRQVAASSQSGQGDGTINGMPKRFAQGFQKAAGHLGDKLIEGTIEMATPEADEGARQLQRNALKFLFDPNQERAQGHFDRMIQGISGSQ